MRGIINLEYDLKLHLDSMSLGKILNSRIIFCRVFVISRKLLKQFCCYETSWNFFVGGLCSFDLHNLHSFGAPFQNSLIWIQKLLNIIIAMYVFLVNNFIHGRQNFFFLYKAANEDFEMKIRSFFFIHLGCRC